MSKKISFEQVKHTLSLIKVDSLGKDIISLGAVKAKRNNNFTFGHRSLRSSLNALRKENLQHIDGYASGFLFSDRPNLTPSCAPKCEVIVTLCLRSFRMKVFLKG